MRNTRLDNCVAFIGRKNSGKTTLVEQLIAELARRGIVVSSLKHHSHDDFEIDIPGKDSYRHHEAGTVATAISSAKRFAVVEDLVRSEPEAESEEDLTDVEALLRTPTREAAETYEQCVRAIGILPASNLILIEGFKRSGLPAVELFRSDNPRDTEAAPAFIARINEHIMNGGATDDAAGSLPAAVVTDMPDVMAAALTADLPVFNFYDIAQITTWLIDTYAKPLYSVVIQSGGESKRMHQSKALVPFHGRPLIEHMIGRLAPLAGELIVTTNEPEKLAYLQVRYPGLRLIPDKYDKRGALPGFITALEAATYPLVAVVACDLANVSVDLIEYEAELLEQSQQADLFMPFDAVVPMSPQGLEPFCAVYERQRALDAALACWNRKKVRMKNVIDSLNVRFIDTENEPLCYEGCFLNVNTPEDLRNAEQAG